MGGIGNMYICIVTVYNWAAGHGYSSVIICVSVSGRNLT